jgi:hypothetical protein
VYRSSGEAQPDDRPRRVRTSLIAPVGAAGELLRPWHDGEPWARHGIEPHVTLLSPFLRTDLIDPEAADLLASAVDACLPLDVAFDRVERLPGAICLLPADDIGLLRATTLLLRPWPHLRATLRTGQHRPYHVTVASTDDNHVHEEIKAALDPLVPITVRLSIIHLVAHDEGDAPVRLLATIPARFQTT